ncbi:hypothetical protein BPOR_0480g00070 [Botrytis porri]|uniref:Uncharacterized protein n=1 Tax=Botrytis porri TaxID=87229 RepID=A0A4Z1KRK3_9HELO|nr:hypothetical protein BPOR_0480g00070 [Botrytis porri]
MSERSSKMIESPIPVPPEAGLEVGYPRHISHQDGLQVDWEVQAKYETALIQREIVAELGGNRQFLRNHRRILGLSVMWFWVFMVVIVAILAAGIGNKIASGMKEKSKNNHSKHSHTESSNITSPCQIDSGANSNSILPVTSHQDTVPTNFRLFCNRTFDVASSFNNSCCAVTINTNETTGQQWCKLFSATEWGTDAVGADCAVNLSPLSLNDTIGLQTRVRNITLASTTFAGCTPASSGSCLEVFTTKGVVTTAPVSLQSVVFVSELVIGGQTPTASKPTSTTYQ